MNARPGDADSTVITIHTEDLKTILADVGLDGSQRLDASSGTLRPPDSQPDALHDEALGRLPILALDELRGPVDFRLREELGAGGMGVVRRAEQVPLGRDVAVKAVREDRCDPESRLALLREAWVTGALEHPNVVPVHALGRDKAGAPLLVMKRIDGVAWTDVMRGASDDPRSSGAADPLGRDLDILLAVANAVAFAHSRGVIHRDLKPENVMVGAFGEVYVVDWGLAVSVRDDDDYRFARAADIRSIAGTPQYLAPEMVRGDGANIGPRSDVFLLGAVLHELITGERRHGGRTLLEVLGAALHVTPFEYGADVPAELADIANKATARDPADRFADASAFRDAVQRFLRHRHSIDIARTAAQRLAELEAILDDPQSSRSAEIGPLLAACRFGFQLALRDWSGNTEARDKLRHALLRVARHELDGGRSATAAALMAELGDPPEDLREALADLRGRERAQAERAAELQRLRSDLDLEAGTRTRAGVAVAFALLYGALPVLGWWATTRWGQRWGHGDSVMLAFGFLGAVATTGIYARHTLLATAPNRRLLRTLLAFGVTEVVFALGGAHHGVAPMHIMTLNLALFAGFMAMLTAAIDTRLWPAALPYVVALFGAGSSVGSPWLWIAAANIVAIGAVAVLWRPGDGYVPLHKRGADETANAESANAESANAEST